MKKETLLEKAKKVKYKKRRGAATNEEIELALAWIKDEVITRQVAEAMGQNAVSGRVLYRLSICLKRAYEQGKLKVK